MSPTWQKVCPHWQFGTLFAIDGVEAGGVLRLPVRRGARYISHRQAAQSLTARRLCGILMAQHGIGKWRSHTLCTGDAQVTHVRSARERVERSASAAWCCMDE